MMLPLPLPFDPGRTFKLEEAALLLISSTLWWRDPVLLLPLDDPDEPLLVV